ncbi:Uncharacterised protein [Gordonia paraffinivorans]|uniref:Transcriptional regulator n=1 Tax=Gordonia paraffinivorans TaxID=175628 RepID=A0ABD7V4A9_9ACTN|nr:Uncharacterised protein [Gordonia paraffinivorans]
MGADPGGDADDVAGEGLSWAALVNALFEHTPGSVPGVPLTGREVCGRANQSRPGRLKEPMLSSLRRGRAVEPGFGIIAAVADGFGVDIEFFTREFHHQHQDQSMAQRVQAANAAWPQLLRLAADINALPEPHRTTIQALITILATRRRDE